MRFDDEKELEDLLYDEFKNLDDPLGVGFGEDYYENFVFRQLEIPGYGITDLVLIEMYNDLDSLYINIIIIELKNVPIGYSEIGQISRYKRGVELYLEEIKSRSKLSKILEFDLKGIIVGPSLNLSNDSCYLLEGIDWLECYLFNISKHGISFDLTSGWHAINIEHSYKNFNFHDEDITGCFLKEYKKTIRTRREMIKRGMKVYGES